MVRLKRRSATSNGSFSLTRIVVMYPGRVASKDDDYSPLAGGLQRPLVAALQRPAAGRGAGPGPLEVVAAEPAGHVDDLTDEIQARYALALHRLRAQVAGVDA